MFAGLAGLIIGLAGYFLTRERSLVGAALVPASGAITALVVWEVLTWLGAVLGLGWLAYDQGWIWWITLGATVLVVGVLAVTVGRRRKRDDDEFFDRLRHVGRARV
ncbi:hypothetical protein [Pseudoclavibacter endophyticus]|nr:hypothetical protein [Pseudoclavibacter endophyticus]